MKNYCLYFLLIFLAACNGQNKTDLPKNSASEPKKNAGWQPEFKIQDNDPYFIETKEITSQFGPSNITRSILQDKNGNIWFASWEGIIRYDGKTFTNFTNKAGLRRYHVFSILEDRAGNLWFGTIGAGAYRFDGNTFTNFTTKNGLVNDLIDCISEDKNGNIWFGTESGASCFDGQIFRNFTKKEGLTDEGVHSIVADKTGKIWLGTWDGAFIYDGNTFSIFKNKAGEPFRNVRSIIEDKNGNIWIGSQDGLCRFDGKVFTNFSTDFVGFVFEDKKGNIWISRGDSKRNMMVLQCLDVDFLTSGKSKFTQNKAESRQVFGITEDKNGNIWFGTENCANRFDGKTFTDFLEK